MLFTWFLSVACILFRIKLSGKEEWVSAEESRKREINSMGYKI